MDMSNGKIIFKSALIVAATVIFIYLYSLIHVPNHENNDRSRKHDPIDMTTVYYLFASFLLLLMGLPILR